MAQNRVDLSSTKELRRKRRRRILTISENELSSTVELSSTREQKSCLPKTKVFGGKELLPSTVQNLPNWLFAEPF